MSEGKFNTLTLEKSNYEDNYSVSEDDFKKAIGEVLLLLMKNNYIAIVRQECNDFVIIEYQYANPEYGTALPYWLSWSEAETVVYDDEKDDEES